jgi:hypothetical protein
MQKGGYEVKKFYIWNTNGACASLDLDVENYNTLEIGSCTLYNSSSMYYVRLYDGDDAVDTSKCIIEYTTTWTTPKVIDVSKYDVVTIRGYVNISSNWRRNCIRKHKCLLTKNTILDIILKLCFFTCIHKL